MGSLATSLGIVLLSLGVAALLSWKRSPGAPADFIIANCSIWTGDRDVPWAESMAVRRGRILRVGSLSFVKEVAGSKTEYRDLEGQFVVPGFIDSHVHFIPGGLELVRLNLHDVHTRLEFTHRVQHAAHGLEPNEWLLGFGWSNEHWGGEWPDSSWIDSVTENNPVWLSRMDGHMGLANKVAMDKCDLMSAKEDPAGGSIIRNEDGVPTGLLVDAAMVLLTSCIPKPSLEQRREALARASQYAASKGVTSVVDFGSYFPGGSAKESWNDFEEVYAWMDSLGNMTVRSALFFPLETWPRVAALIKERGRHLSDWVHVGGVKAFADGSLGSGTALFHQHYEDDPNNFGLRVADLNWLAESVGAAFESNLQVAVHAIGDAANDDVLAIYADAISKHSHQGHRLRVEHAQHLSPGAHIKFGEFSICASMQPEQLLDDAYYAVKKLGEKRSRGSYNLRSLLGNGSVVALGSDWPVVALNPVGGIHAAVERTPSGWSCPWIPEERISAWDALAGYTSSAAFVAALDDLVGSLTPGKLADFVILSESPLTQGAGVLPEVVATFISGSMVFPFN